MKKKGRKQNEKTKKDSKINKNWTNIMSENIKNMKNNNFTDREKQELKAIISKLIQCIGHLPKLKNYNIILDAMLQSFLDSDFKLNNVERNVALIKHSDREVYVEKAMKSGLILTHRDKINYINHMSVRNIFEYLRMRK